MGSAADLPLWAAFVAALAPAGALLVATIAALITWRSHEQHKRADRHQHLWTSLTWALDQLEDPKDSYKVQLGMTVLTSLGTDSLINKTDNQLLKKVNKIVAATNSPSTTEIDTDDPDQNLREAFAHIAKVAASQESGASWYVQRDPDDEPDADEPQDTPQPRA